MESKSESVSKACDEAWFLVLMWSISVIEKSPNVRNVQCYLDLVPVKLSKCD